MDRDSLHLLSNEIFLMYCIMIFLFLPQELKSIEFSGSHGKSFACISNKGPISCAEYCSCLDQFCMSKWNTNIDHNLEEDNENIGVLEDDEM